MIGTYFQRKYRGPVSQRFFYGWVIALCCTLITLINGSIFFTFSVFFKSVALDFGWSRGEVSGNYTAMLVAYAPGAFLGGRLADRYGPRSVLLLAGVLIGLGFIGCSQANSLLFMISSYVIIGLGLGATLAVPTATIQRWFKRWRGLMIGIVVAGTGIGGFIFAPLANHLITLYDWRTAYLIIGIIFGGVVTAAASFLVSEPKKRNLSPFGDMGQGGDSGSYFQDARLPVLTLTQFFKLGAFRGMAALYILSFLPATFIYSHLVPYVTDQGISAAVGAQGFGLIALASVLGRAAMGLLAEKIGWLESLTISNSIASVSIIWLMFVTEPWAFYLFAVVYGVFWGSNLTLLGGAVGFIFGVNSLSELLGFLLGLGILFGAVSPWLGGLIFDLTGSYLTALALTAAFFAASGVLSFLLRPSAR